jgi:hypothetical protein
VTTTHHSTDGLKTPGRIEGIINKRWKSEERKNGHNEDAGSQDRNPPNSSSLLKSAANESSLLIRIRICKQCC